MKIKLLNFKPSNKQLDLLVAKGANCEYYIKKMPYKEEYQYGGLTKYPYGHCGSIAEAKEHLQKIHEQNLIENFLE